MSALKSRKIKETEAKAGRACLGGTGEDEEDTAAAEGTRDRRCAEYTKDGPTGQERSPTKSSSYTHRDSLSFVRSFFVFLFFFRSPSYSFFLFYPCPAIASFDVSTARNVLSTSCRIIRLASGICISNRLLRDPDRVRLFLRLRANFAGLGSY